MWRILAISLVGLAIWVTNLLLPAANEEEQLRSLTRIATQGGDLVPAPHQLAMTDAADATSSDIGAILASVPSPPAPTEVRGAGWLTAIEAPDSKPLLAATNRIVASHLVASALAPVSNGLDSPTPDDSEGQIKLIVKLQEQLRRVGCYKGTADGSWNDTTRRAMARFNDRIKAQFALDTVNPVLLTLVETYGNRACGAPCLPGRIPNANGICVSSQTVAAAALPKPAHAINPAAAKSGVTIVASNDAKSATLTTGAAEQAIDSAWAPSVRMAPSKTVVTAAITPPAPKAASKPLGSNNWTPTVELASTAKAPAPTGVAVALAMPNVVPSAVRTTIVALATSPQRKKHARKSSGWGNTQFAFGGTQRTHRSSSRAWSSAPASYPSIVLSNRFVGSSYGSSSGSSGELTIRKSNK